MVQARAGRLRRRTERPSEESIRDRIRQRLASGQLKAFDGMIVKARPNNLMCSACECEIEPDAATLGYRYLDGEYCEFHVP